MDGLMGIHGQGQDHIVQMRLIRFKEMCIKFRDQASKIENAEDVINRTIEKPQLDDSRFMMKYLDNANSQLYKHYFASFNEKMFAQLMFFTNIRKLSKGEYLYKKGDTDGQNFFYVLKGRIELLVMPAAKDKPIGEPFNEEDLKFSKHVEVDQYFAFRQVSFNDPRTDYARILSDSCEIFQINGQKYLEIMSKTKLTASEKKVEFLIQYVPTFRNLPRRIIEDFEIYFTKEVVTRGYQIQKINEQDDYLYLIFRGVCKILYNVDMLPEVFGESAFYDKQKQKYFVIGHFGRGEMFGEQSALNDLANPFTVVAASPKVELYKIHRSNFYQFFGGADGSSIDQIRTHIILKNNWLCSKITALEAMEVDQLWELEYCNDKDFNQHNPTVVTIKEAQYKQNVHADNLSKAQNTTDGPQMTEKEMRIAELKKSLLAPQPKRKPLAGGGSTVKKETDMQDKFKRVMGWGTPRLVTKNANHRGLNMNNVNMQSRSQLLNYANIRQGKLPVLEKKGPNDFQVSSIANFRKAMLEEEKASEGDVMVKKNLAQKADNQDSSNFGKLNLEDSSNKRSQSLFTDVSINDNPTNNELKQMFLETRQQLGEVQKS